VSISRILYQALKINYCSATAIYLGQMLPTASSGTSRAKRASQKQKVKSYKVNMFIVLLYTLYFTNFQLACFARDTALHSGKDLAVSPPYRYGALPLGEPSSLDLGVSARTSMLAHDGCYPATLLPILPTTGGCNIEHHATAHKSDGGAAYAVLRRNAQF